MCVSCGCDDVFDNHGDSRNITLNDLDQAAQVAGITRERVIQNIAQACQGISVSPAQTAQAGRGDYYQASQLEKQSGLQSEDVSPALGQDLGDAWLESQQMGATGLGEEQNPQADV